MIYKDDFHFISSFLLQTFSTNFLWWTSEIHKKAESKINILLLDSTVFNILPHLLYLHMCKYIHLLTLNLDIFTLLYLDIFTVLFIFGWTIFYFLLKIPFFNWRKIFFNWSTVDLLCHVSFWCTTQYTYMYICMYVYICVYNTYMLCINILTESFPFFRFFSLIGYYKILSVVPYVIQEVLIDYLFYIQ